MFSVVIPLYNKADIIVRTLASVITQTYQNYEVIIVNDGSTDDSIAKIQPFLYDPRFRTIHQENQGVSAARNRGVAEAKFDYIAFLDADDEWLPGFLSKINEAIAIFPNAGMYGTSSWHRNIITGESGESTLKRYNNKIQIVDYFDNPHHMPHTCAMVISKELFNTIFSNGDGFPYGMKCCEDFACFYRVALRIQFVYIGFPLGIRNSGVAGQITGVDAEVRFQLLKHVVDFYNISFLSYLELNKKNKQYEVFSKYDLRCRFKSALMVKEYRSIVYLLDHLNILMISKFPATELSMYRDPKYRLISILYIYLTKILFKISKLLSN